jgi:hypothetical protein
MRYEEVKLQHIACPREVQFDVVTIHSGIGIKETMLSTALKTIAAFLVVLALSGQDPVPPIRNFIRMNKEFCTGFQPRPDQLETLKKEGVKSIINLRQPGEHRSAEEETKAKELGLRYFNIPFVYADPKDEQVDEFLKIRDYVLALSG